MGDGVDMGEEGFVEREKVVEVVDKECDGRLWGKFDEVVEEMGKVLGGGDGWEWEVVVYLKGVVVREMGLGFGGKKEIENGLVVVWVGEE